MIYRAVAPGRINLIGEHTDYNQGFVLPAAIDMVVELTCEALKGRVIKVFAENFNDEQSFTLDKLNPPSDKAVWIDYVRAVCWAMEEAGYYLGGASIKIDSKIPIGAGLSSSAALELAVAGALTALNGYDLSPEKLALLCQKAENDFVGVQCGIMDQYAVALGQKNMALFLDCRSLAYDLVALELKNCRFLIVDSRVERSLSASEYNRRRQECEEAVQELSKIYGKEFSALRDISLEEVKAARPFLPALLYKRCRYVVEENMRVKEAVIALKSGDLEKFGYLMKRSHAGLKELYEVSCPELDMIVDTAMLVEGALGARMTGAGFGGCAIILVEEKALQAVTEKISQAFSALDWHKPFFYVTTVVNGLRVEKL